MSKESNKEYLPYYLGAECMMTKNSYHAVHELNLSHKDSFILTAKLLAYFIASTTKAEIKPKLRTLNSLTKEEHEEWSAIRFNEDFKLKPLYSDNDYNAFHWLLKNKFDIFGLIEANLAIKK